MKEARLYTRAEGGNASCRLCAFRCRVHVGKRGICGVRENVDGVLYTHTWGRVVAANVDPIEKKPLYHFQPSSRSYSIATAGCNFKCLHCQNSDISQMPRDKGVVLGEEATPEEIVNDAYETGSTSISYTYTEPTIFFEFAQDIGALARDRGLKNVFVTNGYHGADHILRVRAGHRSARQGPGPEERIRHERLHDSRLHRGAEGLSRCRKHRP